MAVVRLRRTYQNELVPCTRTIHRAILAHNFSKVSLRSTQKVHYDAQTTKTTYKPIQFVFHPSLHNFYKNATMIHQNKKKFFF